MKFKFSIFILLFLNFIFSSCSLITSKEEDIISQCRNDIDCIVAYINKENKPFMNFSYKTFYKHVKSCKKGNMESCYIAQSFLSKDRKLYPIAYNSMIIFCKDKYKNICKGNYEYKTSKNCEKLENALKDVNLKLADYDKDILPYYYGYNTILKLCKKNNHFKENKKYNSFCYYMEKEKFLDEYYQGTRSSIKYLDYCPCSKRNACPLIELLLYGMSGLYLACKEEYSEKGCKYFKNLCKEALPKICEKDKNICKSLKYYCNK